MKEIKETKIVEKCWKTKLPPLRMGIIKNMKKAERLISEITINNLDDKTWIKQLRSSLGYLRNSIENYQKIKNKK